MKKRSRTGRVALQGQQHLVSSCTCRIQPSTRPRWMAAWTQRASTRSLTVRTASNACICSGEEGDGDHDGEEGGDEERGAMTMLKAMRTTRRIEGEGVAKMRMMMKTIGSR
jgi:hypothetical protein